MYAGFDYGTSNCAISIINNRQAELVPLEGNKHFVPSTLYAYDRALVTDAVARGISDTTQRQLYMSTRAVQLRNAQVAKADLDILGDEKVWFMGEEAIENYIAYPAEGWFVKSPKSFLGAKGLQPAQVVFFEDIVSLMMQNIKTLAEAQQQTCIEEVVIGRPINFQGSGCDESNRQAISILENAARNAGFKACEFFYEPLAAGIDFETRLSEDQTVLVLDIGGGTSDCSIVRMGPSYRENSHRDNDFLAHSGIRVGGNNLDIDLNFSSLMPHFGKGSELKSGLPIPFQYYSNAAKVNDVSAQSAFNSASNARSLKQLYSDAKENELIKRLQTLQANNQTYQLSRSAELAKIALSDGDNTSVDLGYIEERLAVDIKKAELVSAVENSVKSMMALMQEAISQAESEPDIIYITGGSAKSPIIRQAIERSLPGTRIVDGDYFGSVAAGLAKWAERLFR